MFYFQVVLLLMITSATYMLGSILIGLTDSMPNATLYNIALAIFILCVVVYFFVFVPPTNVILWR